MTDFGDELPENELIPLLKALAEPNRLRIFAELMHGNSCNGDLQAKLGLPANLLSHHLRVLSRAGLVASRRDTMDGRWIYYSLNEDVITRWHEWFAFFFDPMRIKERPFCGPEGNCGDTVREVY
jgi:DNA-binding transcriptional ArsR family regulator